MSSFGLFIPEGNTQKGSLNIKGNVRIEGSFEGDIIHEEIFTLGEKGGFIGSLECLEAHIMGYFEGNLRAEQCILYSTAKFRGLLDVGIAQIEKGSQLYGEICITGQKP